MHTFFFFLLSFFSWPFALFYFSSLVPYSAMHLHASISPILGSLFPFLPALAVLLDTQHFTATFSSCLSFFSLFFPSAAYISLDGHGPWPLHVYTNWSRGSGLSQWAVIHE